MTSSMKPEVHNVSQRRQRRTVPRTQVTCKKCGEDRTRSSRDIWSRTDSQTDTVITILCFPYSVIVCSKGSSCSWSIILGCNICSGFPVPITIITSVMCNNYLCKFLKVQRLHFTGAVDKMHNRLRQNSSAFYTRKIIKIGLHLTELL